MEAEEKKKLNQYALSFDMGCVDAVRNILQAIKQSPPEEIEAWRQKARRPGETSIEVYLFPSPPLPPSLFFFTRNISLTFLFLSMKIGKDQVFAI